MTIPGVLVGVIAMLVVQVIVFAVAWGDLRRQVISNKNLQDERHEENKDRLERMDGNLDRVVTRLGHLEAKVR